MVTVWTLAVTVVGYGTAEWWFVMGCVTTMMMQREAVGEVCQREMEAGCARVRKTKEITNSIQNRSGGKVCEWAAYSKKIAWFAVNRVENTPTDSILTHTVSTEVIYQRCWCVCVREREGDASFTVAKQTVIDSKIVHVLAEGFPI